ncbi:MAG: YfhO family protein, partial [Gemmataceae bacterium]|nr:YfhO family protein [Gemmataceae bacterium]
MLLWLIYFHPLILHPTHTLYAPYSDFVAEHLPAKLFLNREWRSAGELPLWNPYHFCGAPFIHDVQVGAFYPPNAVVYLVPENAVGAAMSWVIALHVLAAGLFAYIYARSHRLNAAGSLVAAAGFMLSSKWMTHLLLAGHSITIGMAWLPLFLLCIEKNLANRNVRFILYAGLCLALIGLGTHPQWAVYTVLFALAWTFPRTRDERFRWVKCWVGAVAVATLLCAVQLLPTLEAGRWSARSSGVEASGALVVGLPTALKLIGPSLAYSPPHSWEMQGVFG